MSAYDDLLSYASETFALGQILWRQSWDQEVLMPAGAAPQRADEIAALEGVIHSRKSAPQVGDWLAAVDPKNEVQAAQLRHIRHSYDRATRVPADLASELARKTSLGMGIWVEARKTEDVAAFLPILTEIVDLRRQQASALADGGELYDALIDEYEPGATAASLGEMFDTMRPRLVNLRERILGSEVTPPKLRGPFDEDKQMQLTTEIARLFGYDFDHGRIDKAVHPSSNGCGLDIRITTRTDPDEPLGCFYSTIHEVGHATYEQNIDRTYLLTPLGQGVSNGVHESQSRIYENQLGRSRAFTGRLYDRMRDVFGGLGLASAEAFYAAVNRVETGYIRTEADEVHYNLHVMLRFDLERALIKGDLQVADLEAAWNDRFEADFGLKVDKPSNGMLQDVHWSLGAIGYFPTYSLGNLYAGCLFDAMKGEVPDMMRALSKGDASPATGWLRDKLQRHGGLYEPQDVVERATGAPVSAEPLLDYLDAKFGRLYRL